MAGNASLSITLSVLPGKSYSWFFFFFFVCCNHMRPHLSLFSKLEPAPHPLNSCIADGSTMHGNNLGFVSTSNISVPRVFHILDISYNLFSVDQLAELGFRLIFYYYGYTVQDSRMGRKLGTSPRVECCFLWTIFIFHLLLLFLLLLQLLRFLLYLLSHFCILVLVMHPFLGFNS